MSDDPNLWGQVFGEQGLLTMTFGAMGGLVRSATLKTTWKEGVRVVVVGSLTAFCVGSLAPAMLENFGILPKDLPEEVTGAIGYICASAFFIGLMGVTIVERMIGAPKQEDQKK